jgi:tetratricopeptide (TPR) repeat protein
MNETSVARPLIERIEADPLNIPLYHRLAELYVSDGQFRKAELVLRRAIDIAPLTRETWSRLAGLLSSLGKWASAVEAFERAAALGPPTGDDSIGFAFALLANQELRRAGQLSSRLLEAFPQRPESHLIAGHIAKVQGHFDAAVAHYQAALGLDSAMTEAAYHLADVAPAACSGWLTQELEAKREDRTLVAGQRADVLFALSRLYEHADRVDSTFNTLLEANDAAQEAMTRSGQGYDADEIANQATDIITTFTAQVFPSPLDPIDLGTKLIFIVGLPRSGTTLIDRILSSHPRVVSGGELPFMQECLEKYLAARRKAGLRGAVATSDVSERQLLLAVRTDYLDRIFERDLDADFVIDKLPANFAAVGLIRILFPDATIVYCRRDPMATCWSLFRSHFGLHASYSTGFKQLAHYYQVYARYMAHWKATVKAPLNEIRYEELIARPEPSIRGLLDACGLEWAEVCLRFEQNAAPVYTASVRDVRRPLYDTSASRWEKFSHRLAPLAEELAGFTQAYSEELKNRKTQRPQA